MLIDVLKRFASEAPAIHVRVSTMNEREVEQALLRDPEVAFGLAAPYEQSPELEYHDLFAMSWSVITARGSIGSRRSDGPTLQDTAAKPLILYERGSTGRQHVLDAFNELGLIPTRRARDDEHRDDREHGRGGAGRLAIVPLLAEAATVTRGRRVHVRPLTRAIRPIHSGILLRRGERLSAAASRLLEFTRALCASESFLTASRIRYHGVTFPREGDCAFLTAIRTLPSCYQAVVAPPTGGAPLASIAVFAALMGRRAFASVGTDAPDTFPEKLLGYLRTLVSPFTTGRQPFTTGCQVLLQRALVFTMPGSSTEGQQSAPSSSVSTIYGASDSQSLHLGPRGAGERTRHEGADPAALTVQVNSPTKQARPSFRLDRSRLHPLDACSFYSEPRSTRQTAAVTVR